MNHAHVAFLPKVFRTTFPNFFNAIQNCTYRRSRKYKMNCILDWTNGTQFVSDYLRYSYDLIYIAEISHIKGVPKTKRRIEWNEISFRREKRIPFPLILEPTRSFQRCRASSPRKWTANRNSPRSFSRRGSNLNVAVTMTVSNARLSKRKERRKKREREKE